MRNKLALLLMTVGFAGLLTGGCPVSPPPEITGLAKVANNQLSQLTSTEVSALVDAASALDSSIDISLTESESQAVVDFLSANSINSPSDLESTITDAFEDPGSIVIPEGAIAILVGAVESVESSEGTQNQGGGSLVSAVEKIVNGQISTWTADEAQLVGLNLQAISNGQEGVALTDEQAAGLVEFLQANEIDTVADWEAAVSDLDDASIPAGSEALFDNL